MASETFADHVEDLKPVISAGLSDSAALDAVAELMVRAGRDLPMVKTMLIPEAWGDEPSMPQAYRDLYSYCNAVMEPWDGPAAVCGFGGRWAIAVLDCNGLRPQRYTIQTDGLLLPHSETRLMPIRSDSGIGRRSYIPRNTGG